MSLPRIRFISHKGKQILLVDLSKCSASEVEKTVRGVPDYVTTQPQGSVLLLADFTSATFDQEALHAMKEAAVFNKPYIKRTAWVRRREPSGRVPPESKKFLQT